MICGLDGGFVIVVFVRWFFRVGFGLLGSCFFWLELCSCLFDCGCDEGVFFAGIIYCVWVLDFRSWSRKGIFVFFY